MTHGRPATALVMVAILALAIPAFGADEATATLDVKLSVKGMTCSGCVNAVRNTLEGIAGVKKAEVSLEKNEALVTYEKGKTTPEALAKAVEKAGFKCSPAKEKPAGA